MIIDGHAHLGGEYRDLHNIIATLDASGVDKVILCPSDKIRSKAMFIPGISGMIAGSELNFQINRFLRTATNNYRSRHYIETGNEEVFNISRQSDGRVIQFYWADPNRKNVTEEIETKLALWKFQGIKLHQSCHPFKIKSEPFYRIAEFAALKNLPVFIHLHSRKELVDFISISRDYQTKFITGHLIGLEIYIKHKKSVADNVYFDISCPPLVPLDLIMLAIREFGAARIVMGSDTPYGRNNVRKAVNAIRSLKISNREKEMILGNNMRDILMAR
jgi:predicted TIM-barrel fold metal-dependent hydrolase